MNFEHAATGAAQVVPNHSIYADLWEGAAERVEPAMTILNELSLTDAALVDPVDVAAALERLYADPDYRLLLGEKGRRLASHEDYRWSAIAHRWGEIFDEVIARAA